MTQPVAYNPIADFSADATNNAAGRSTVDTVKLDDEFERIEDTLDQTLANLALIQRDDTKLKDRIVETHALATEVLALLALDDTVIRGAWLTATVYAQKDVVLQSSLVYMCFVAHTSGTFATDLAAGKWGVISAGVSPFGSTLIDDADASAALTTLGVSTYIKTLVDDADATTAAATLAVPRLNNLRGYIDGLTLSHASVSSITIAPGIAMDSTRTLFLERTTSITKLLNAAWAEGSAAGGLDTGAEAANTWYYVHLIRKTSNGAIDALFSTSMTAPTMPGGWVERRYIGAVFNNSGSDLRLFVQNGDTFTWTSNPPPQDINATATLISASGTLFTMSVPPLAAPEVIFCAHFADSVANYLYLSSPAQPDNTADPAAGRSHLSCSATTDNAGMFQIRTNTSGQIRARGNNGTGGELYASTLGWVDLRGKDA